MKKRFHT